MNWDLDYELKWKVKLQGLIKTEKVIIDTINKRKWLYQSQ